MLGEQSRYKQSHPNFINKHRAASINEKWRDYVDSLHGVLDADVKHVLQMLFPPSGVGCYGSNQIAQVCHYTNLVSVQARFYFVYEGDLGKLELPHAWLEHFSGT